MSKNNKFEKRKKVITKNTYPESTEMSSLSERPAIVGFFFSEQEAKELTILLSNILGAEHPTIEYMNSKINRKK